MIAVDESSYVPYPPAEQLDALLEACKEWRRAYAEQVPARSVIERQALAEAIDAAYPPEPKSRLNKRHREMLENALAWEPPDSTIRLEIGVAHLAFDTLRALLKEAEILDA